MERIVASQEKCACAVRLPCVGAVDRYGWRPILRDLVPTLGRLGEAGLHGATAALLRSMAAVTIECRLAEDRRELDLARAIPNPL
ncbi:hypothetical protein CJ179_48020 [Rhodococcus sp. ACS1]|uniref:hypothetical protein n=1 Tax=Rhodococcus sp. ACS1 TaxID=2028570 RepID=UPI000BB11020|nr:hypothetical protein [Rhodococcus sp. ACS1]PBC35359.1 hypothetical protein CJ179_48020 [Rhodococcus sp. ACS1]